MKNKFFSQYILLLFLALPMFERSLQTDEHREEALAKPEFKRVLTIEEVLTVQPKERPHYATSGTSLPSSSTCVNTDPCYIRHSYNKAEPTTAEPELQAAACALKAALPEQHFRDSFCIYEASVLSTLSYSKSKEGYAAAKKIYSTKGPSEKDYFLKFINIMDKGVKVDYDFSLHLPRTGSLSMNTDFLESNIVEILRRVYEENKSDIVIDVKAQSAVINKLIEILGNFNQYGDLTEENLDSFGFIELETEGQFPEFTRTGAVTSEDEFTDYTGLSKDQDFLRNYIVQGFQQPLFTSYILLTDNLNHSTTDRDCNFNNASKKFVESQSQLTVWFHYFTKPGVRKLYYKPKSNITIQQAEDYMALYTRSVYPPDPVSTFQGTEEGDRSADCPNFASLNRKWRTLGNDGKNYYNCAEDYTNTNFQAGFNCGVIDQVMTLFEFLANTLESCSPQPVTIVSLDCWKKIAQKIFTVENMILLADLTYNPFPTERKAQFYTKLLNGVKLLVYELYNQLKSGLSYTMVNIFKMFQTYCLDGSDTIKEYDKQLGYAYGKDLFNIVLTLIGPGGGLKALKGIDLVVAKDVVTTFAKSNVDDLGKLFQRLRSTPKTKPLIDDLVKKVRKVARKNWKGFSNIFVATADEVFEAANRIKSYRTSTNLSKKNCGYLEGTVNGTLVDNKIWISGPANTQLEPQIFTAISAEGGGGRSWLRNTDSEYKMLNKLADDLGGTSGSVHPNVSGELKIVSELEYCASCQGIIQQFNQMFPNVKLILVDGAN